ncbi:MAG: hypothetical protein ACRC92_26185 [Peptostreptococcaceae bacterium]
MRRTGYENLKGVVKDPIVNSVTLPHLGGGAMTEFMITSYSLDDTDTTLYYENVADNYTSNTEIHMIFKTACEYLASVIRNEREMDMELLNGLLKGTSKYCPEPKVKFSGTAPFSESVGFILEVKAGTKLVMTITHNSLSFHDTAITLANYRPFSVDENGDLPNHDLAITDTDMDVQPVATMTDGMVAIAFKSNINPNFSLWYMVLNLDIVIKLLSHPYDYSLSDLFHNAKRLEDLNNHWKLEENLITILRNVVDGLRDDMKNGK